MTEVRLTDEEVLAWLRRARRRVLSKMTMIYFMQGVDGGPIKIGQSTDPEKRLISVQNGNPVKLQLTRVVPGIEADERWLHDLFQDFRLNGEWFKPHPLIARIADAIPDKSLADEPICNHNERLAKHEHHDVCMVIAMTASKYEMTKEEFDLRYKYGFHEQERTITFRPEPDEDGWRNSSAA